MYQFIEGAIFIAIACVSLLGAAQTWDFHPLTALVCMLVGLGFGAVGISILYDGD